METPGKQTQKLKTVPFSFLVWETALATVTGRGRGGGSVLSSFRHLGVGFDVDVARNMGTVVVTVTVAPALSVPGERLQWWLPWVWKGSCRLQTGILLPPVTSLSSPLPSPGLGCAQLSLRKAVSTERSGCLESRRSRQARGGLPEAHARMAARLKQQSRCGRNSRGQGLVLP